MATDEDIYDQKLTPADARKLKGVIEGTENTAPLLFWIAEWLDENDDAKGSFIVEQAAWKLAGHEAESG